MYPKLSALVCLCLVMTTSVFADEKTVTAKVKAVDAAKNSITLDDLTLDVTRKTKITVDGKKAKLEDIKTDQQAKVTYDDGLEVAVSITVEKRADGDGNPVEGDAEALLGDSLDKWNAPKKGEDISNWSITEGVLRLDEAGPSLRTKKTYEDFDLHLEFKLPPKNNTGVFLRGRYEVQLLDSQFRTKDGRPVPPKESCGAIYGQLAPSKDVYRGSNKWNTLDVRLIGNVVTVRINDVVVIDSKAIDVVTGGDLDENESDPGPILLQAHATHGQEFRNITIKPIAEAK
jgi:hypothetical protein